MADLLGMGISTEAVDAIYSDASRRLRDFVGVLVALLRSLPVLHADETTDRLGTKTCWMHVVSTAMFTLIHASVTRGGDAIDEAGVLRGYRGVVIHDRLVMYWKLKASTACAERTCSVTSPTSLRSPPDAVGSRPPLRCSSRSTQRATTLAGAAFANSPPRQSGFAARYDALVAQGLATNPEPASGRKRDYYQRRSHNLVSAFADHRRHPSLGTAAPPHPRATAWR